VEALQAEGYVVLPGNAGLTEPPPDIAVVWLTPSANGKSREGLALVKALSEARIPFIAVTQAKGERLRQLIIEHGANGCFIQPVDTNVLVPLIQAGLQWSAQWRRLGEDHRCLVEALVESRSIGTAVGIIAERHRLTPQGAFERLRRQARHERRRVADLAAGVVNGSEDLPRGCTTA
jgi:response regulator NasT